MKRKLLRVLIPVCAAAVLYVLPVSAKSIDTVIRYDYPNHKVEIRGTTESADGFVMITVLDKAKAVDFDAYKNSGDMDGCVLFRDQVEVENGKFSIEMGYDPGDNSDFSGNYRTALVSSGGADRTEFDLALVRSDDLKNAYKLLNDAAKQDDLNRFAEIINQKKYVLGFESDLLKNGVSEKYLSNYFEYVKKNELVEEKAEFNTKMFKTYIVSSFANDGKLENIGGYLEDIYIDDASLIADYKKYCISDETEKYFIKKCSGRNISDYDEFKKAFAAAVVLSGTRYPNGSDTVRYLAGRYSKLLGIPGGVPYSAYTKMLGEDYSDIADFNKYLQNSISASTDKNGGSGGGGGAGGSGAGLSSFGDMPYSMPVNEQPKQEPVSIVFDDLDSVYWAIEAITSLADKGIINGTAPNKFSPDEDVTREEFSKILVGAMGLESGTYDKGSFDDIDSSDWCEKYVEIAAKHGIVNGIDSRTFGKGRLISRQDMAVMLYRALKFSGAELPEGELIFEDSGKIADYAKDAVGILYTMGVINGMTDTEFAPESNATRAQAAKMVYGVLGSLAR